MDVQEEVDKVVDYIFGLPVMDPDKVGRLQAIEFFEHLVVYCQTEIDGLKAGLA